MRGQTYYQRWLAPREVGATDQLSMRKSRKRGVLCGDKKDYFKKDVLPKEATQARKLIRETSKYTLIGKHLYKRGFFFPILNCLNIDEVGYVMREVHKGIRESHIGGRALASKVASVGYYWPTLKHDCLEYVKRCDLCQQFAYIHKASLEQLHSIISPWSFHKWGIDILGLFPTALGQIKYLIILVDYFTKWVEVESVATISAKRVKRFYWA
ncbi:Gypsy retrotransposon integrase-like protein 1, partial [Mucuna pruriens]